jgi:DNA helicase HerA-like ATPase
MTKQDQFLQQIAAQYRFKGDSIILGGAMYEGQCQKEAFIRLPLKTFNRHGLIAGATGTGKTKTLQILAEQLSAQGIPSMVMDIKGDLSGVAVPSAGHSKIDERHEQIGLPFIPDASPVELLSLSQEPGVRLRATVSEFGPTLFSKMLALNELQEGVMAVLFKYCDDHDLPLLDLKDLKKLLQYAISDGQESIEAEYGRVSSASVGAIMRRIVELEQQGAEIFFGEPSLDVDDLMRKDADGNGVINILRLTDIQDRPKLFSTFMLQLQAEIYAQFPEEGDLEKPKLVLFIDEAHLVFDEATDALLDQIEVIVKLIRSKGVGIFFITQNPDDIPEEVLSQLGMKIQHALRAFTAKDRRGIKLAVENYPLTEYYDVDQLITELGIGEALVTALDEKGIPTPLVHVLLRAPQSRMDILTQGEIQAIIDQSELIAHYNREIDRDSAYEILGGKMEEAREASHKAEMEKQRSAGRRTSSRRNKSIWESTTTRQIGRTVARELTRGLLSVLGVRRTTRRRSTIKLPW